MYGRRSDEMSSPVQLLSLTKCRWTKCPLWSTYIVIDQNVDELNVLYELGYIVMNIMSLKENQLCYLWQNVAEQNFLSIKMSLDKMSLITISTDYFYSKMSLDRHCHWLFLNQMSSKNIVRYLFNNCRLTKCRIKTTTIVIDHFFNNYNFLAFSKNKTLFIKRSFCFIWCWISKLDLKLNVRLNRIQYNKIKTIHSIKMS